MSQTSKIMAALKALPKDATFDTTTLLKQLEGVSLGALTGLMARLTKERGARIVATTRDPVTGRNRHTYKIENLKAIGTREEPKKRKRKYRLTRAKDARVAEATGRRLILDMLKDCTAQVEAMRTNLADWTTDELLAEVRRRVG